MAEPKTPGNGAFRLPDMLNNPALDPGQLSRSMADIAERSQRIVADFLRRQPEQGPVGP